MKILSRLIVGLAFCLVVLGGVVHNTGSSLACPDWPLCFGQVLPKMEGHVAIEHSHRLLASLVGLLVIALVVQNARRRRENPLLFNLSLGALGLVVFQGVLGGVTVLMRLSPIVSTAHLATSQLFLALMLYIAFRITPGPRGLDPATVSPQALRGLKVAAIGLFLQMLLGAFIRHGGAAVACGLGPDALFSCADPTDGQHLWPSIIQAQLHMLHRYMGLGVMGAVIWGTLPALKWAKSQGDRLTKLMCIKCHALVTLQVILGFLTIYTYIGTVTVTLHLAVAVALWINLLCLNYRLRFVAAGAPA